MGQSGQAETRSRGVDDAPEKEKYERPYDADDEGAVVLRRAHGRER